MLTSIDFLIWCITGYNYQLITNCRTRIDEISISRDLNSITDLDIKFSYYLEPKFHIDFVCCKAFKAIGFIMRLTEDFKQGVSLKGLFYSVVGPIIEYGRVVRDPCTAVGSVQLERIKRKSLRFVSSILKTHCPLHDYAPVANLLGLSSLDERRHTAVIKCISGLLGVNVVYCLFYFLRYPNGQQEPPFLSLSLIIFPQII
jgi:hypothetical protein